MKRCSKCSKRLPLIKFSNSVKNGKSSECKTCHNERYRRNSARHITQVKARKVLTTIVNKQYVDDYLMFHPCVDCGETDIIVLDFDHVRGKKIGNISHMVSEGYSLKTIIKEITKCEIRCANDHRRKTIRNKEYAPVAQLDQSNRLLPGRLQVQILPGVPKL